ncbi:nucleotidyltransferase [Clostridium zeae]|uniref:Nucleotidyltransferase n=1 Tax=Clostridium zeae TaxID=2759022 RepID=A0ABQ1E4V1_9CLOT|nr:aminoglycoside adenylyltransferase domain-containing protein [Clostridium zeae]GFZ29758.1 nucleotidyltransferase [Clostridium zeae]
MTILIPQNIEQVLFAYENELKCTFNDKVFGVYIYNSVALGNFDDNKSDIDFITVINEDFNDVDLKKLKLIHQKLINAYKYARKMEVMYIKFDEVGKGNNEISPYLYFADRKLHEYGYYDINSVTWWTLKNYGIAIKSPDISNLQLNVEWKDVITNMNHNLNFYWKTKLKNKFIFITDYWIEFSILTLCRILYTFENNKITSKVEAAEFASNVVDEKYKMIISEALRIRTAASKKSLYKFRVVRQREARVFIENIITYCNDKYSLI